MKHTLRQYNRKLNSVCAKGKIKLTYVNPAYTSQQCNNCGYIDKKNRNGESFECVCCGLKRHADICSCKNIISRASDMRINIYMKAKEVSELLTKDFNYGKWFTLGKKITHPADKQDKTC